MRIKNFNYKNNIKRYSPWYYLENLLWVTGLICIASYLSLLSVRQAASQAEIDKFIGQLETEAKTKATNSDTSSLLPIPEHNKSLWSQQRIKAYTIASELINSRVTIGVMNIPNLGLQAPIYKGVDELVLNRGLGWIPETAPIGIPGNIAIAGHRDSFFRVLKDIKKDDVIEVVGSESTKRYRVTDTWIVTPDAVHVLDNTTQPVLTLVTCYPFYYVGHAPKRFIVRAAAIDPS